MSLKPGYKKTEIGVIPEDWELKMLGDIGESLIGLTYAPANVAAEGTLVLRSSNIQNDRLTFDDNVYVRSAVPQKIMVQEGDLLIRVRNGSRDLIGKCAVIDDRAVGATFGAFMAVFRSRKNHFVSHQFQSELVKKQINKHLGATINQITNRSLNSFCIPVPASTDEQKVIAEALSDVDALIDSLESLLTKKRNIKTGLMQELLTGRTRLPGSTGKFQEASLRSFLTINKGNLITEKTAREGDIPVIAGGKTAAYFHNVPNRLKSTVTISGSGANAGFVAFHDYPIYASDCSTIEEKESFHLKYIYFTLLLKQTEIYRSQTGGAQPHIHPRNLYPLMIQLPDLYEQVAIARVLSDIDDEIEILSKRLAKTRDLKQGMAQELLTGRTRLI